MERTLSGFGSITGKVVAESAKKFGTPHYLYDGGLIIDKSHEVLNMPNAYGIIVRYAPKANTAFN